MGKSRDEIQDTEVKKQDFIESQVETQPITEAEKRHALQMYESYARQAAVAIDPKQKEALEKLRDEWKAKSGL